MEKETIEDLIVRYTKEYKQLQKNAKKEENFTQSNLMLIKAITLVDVILDLEQTI